MKDLMESYDGMLRYARAFFGGVNLSFNEYDVVHEAFLNYLKGDKVTSLKKEVGRAFYAEKRGLAKGDLIEGYSVNGLREERRFCHNCAEDKPIAAFRHKHVNQFLVSIIICKECENKIIKEHYQKNKNDPEFKKKNTDRNLSNYYKNRDKILAKRKQERQTEEKKQYLKRWRELNIDQVRQKAKEAQKRYYYRKNKSGDAQ